jgi:NADPH:quinone reductase-like Zn-dependent oxidoreductase
VFGSTPARAAADLAVVNATGKIPAAEARHTPDGVDDRTAATLAATGHTAAAASAVLGLGPSDTALTSGAGAGVGVFAAQLARIAEARMIGTASAAPAGHLRESGAEPVTYGEGLVDRARALAPRGVTAALDLLDL